MSELKNGPDRRHDFAKNRLGQEHESPFTRKEESLVADIFRRLIVVAGLLLPGPVNAQASGDACIQIDHADRLTWQQFRSDAGIVSEITITRLTKNIKTKRGTAVELDTFLIRGTGKKCLKSFWQNHVSIVDACRDPVSGQVYTVLFTGAGAHFDLEIWSIDPETGDPTREYMEGWTDSYESMEGPADYPYAGGIWKPVAPGGQCQWRARQTVRQRYDDALQALSVDVTSEEAVRFDEVERLSVRRLDPKTVRHLLVSLDDTTTIEGASYGSSQDQANWRVVQLRGNARCDSPGTVLVLNRTTGQWHAIYDVMSGCGYRLDYPLFGLHVDNGHLNVSACITCSSHGMYDSFSVDLATWRVRRLNQNDMFAGGPPDSKENPRIRDIGREVFGD